MDVSFWGKAPWRHFCIRRLDATKRRGYTVNKKTPISFDFTLIYLVSLRVAFFFFSYFFPLLTICSFFLSVFTFHPFYDFIMFRWRWPNKITRVRVTDIRILANFFLLFQTFRFSNSMYSDSDTRTDYSCICTQLPFVFVYLVFVLFISFVPRIARCFHFVFVKIDRKRGLRRCSRMTHSTAS